ncbi:hypothetical protein L6452_28721 [Arctium lappa]|uniref:Uncharacterized protein n=1 Tax=Arctium lappa TaxID=4217 RepID=A0ACB8ZYA9_ARCLA|nr:hypothetical protein L6452_28721 [Arctium lappa]
MGRRTLGVVTKCDLFPDGLLEKVTANDVGIRLGYICVRNRIDDESYDEARVREDTLFRTHPLLSKIDKSMVGIPSLARRIIEIQLMMISKRLSDFVKKIDERLDSFVLELNKLSPTLTMVPDAMTELMQIVGSLKETLQEILIRGEFDKYKNDKQMHFNARLAEMLDEFSKELHSRVKFSDNFLVEEMQVLEKTKGIRLPHFVADSAFLCLLGKKVDNISKLPKAGHNAMAKMKAEFLERVVEMIEIKKTTYYTCDPNLNRSLKKLMGSHGSFVNAIEGLRAYTRNSSEINVEGYGTIDIKHLVSVAESVRDQAFDLKIRMTAYWEIVLNRMVDWIALQLRFIIKQMVNTEMGTEIVNEVLVNDGGIETMMVEPSSMAAKREGLRKNIRLLQESKKVIGKVIDDVVSLAQT